MYLGGKLSDQASENKLGVKSTNFEKFLARIVMAICYLGALLFFVELFSWRKFLSSPEYYETHQGVSYVFSGIGALVSAYLFWFKSSFVEVLQSKSGSGLFTLFIRTCFPLFVAIIAHQLPMTAYPMIHALVAGGKVTVIYTVENATIFSDRKCANRIQLRSLPFFNDSACSFPEEVRNQLLPGMQIELEGWGTENGLFYDRIKIPEGS